jgi:hypothetical protein
MSAIVTNGVVREGMTSRSGITASFAPYHSEMTCRSCGATIADKAIVCYRCGTPTAGPPAPARPATRARAPWAFLVAVLFCALTAASVAIVSPEHRTAAAVAGGLIAVALGAWVLLRWLGR